MIQPPDIEAFREWNRTQKTRKLVDKLMSEQEAISKFVYDGCYIGTELYGTVRCPMSLVRELIRSGKKDLRVCGQGVLELDRSNRFWGGEKIGYHLHRPGSVWHLQRLAPGG